MYARPSYSRGGSRFLEAIHHGQALEVEMNTLQTISFTGHTPHRAIGTRNLNGCTAIIVISEFAALIAHISPLPYSTSDPYAGEDQMRHFVQRICHKLRNLDEDFYSAGRMKAGIVCATVGGRVALPEQVRLAEDTLMRVCGRGRVGVFKYEAGNGGGHTGARGTVFVDGSAGFGKVFVEDKDVRWFREL
ncbi:hypothetical protein FQN54_000003 [Arachnomyces sp. PD_36]|nr:hypothetical protein FQN54_000003 [Arachnomyces sp. PD_36]